MVFPDFILILLLMACADLLWWQSADRKLRRVRGAPQWRALLGIFMGLQLLYLLVALVLPWEIRRSRSFIPMTWHTQAYIWHMIVLPVLVLGMIWGRIRNGRQKREPAFNPAPPTASYSRTPVLRGKDSKKVSSSSATGTNPLPSPPPE
jgi:amino acid transporter